MSKKPAPSFDDTRQYKNDSNSSKEVKEYCSTCGEVHGRECPEYYKVIQLDYILHGEEPKPECDHIVGLRRLVHMNGSIQPGLLEVYDSDKYGKEHMIRHYKLCPECGEKLNLKKDE